MDLSSQDVEVISRCGHVDKLHVAVLDLSRDLVLVRVDIRMVVAQLQESLNAGGRVLGSLSVVSVWKRQCQA